MSSETEITIETIPVTRKCFPREPILLRSSSLEPGTYKLGPRKRLFWKAEKGKVYFLKNMHWFRTLTFEVAQE